MEITAETVKKLIREQFPKWKNLPVYPVAKSGNDNRTFHLGNQLLVRLPSAASYAPQAEKEARWLPYLSKHLSLPISRPVASGRPSADYPFPWSVNLYIEGETADKDNIKDKIVFAEELSDFLKELQGIDTADAPLAGEHNFFRGASPDVYGSEVLEALKKYKMELPTEKIQIIWKRAVSSKWENAPVWIHGDVAPGNLLVKNGRLCAVIDFGIMGAGDPACDYAMAWTFFDKESRKYFLKELDDKTIERARGWALWKALVTYSDRNREWADNAKYTIKEILEEYDEEVKCQQTV